MPAVNRQLTQFDEMPFDYDARVDRLKGEGFEAKVLIERVNSRIKVLRHNGPDLKALIRILLEMGRQEGITKISVLGREDEWETFISRGFVLEGILKGCFRGQDGYIVARFLDPKRRYSKFLEEQNLAIEEIVEIPPSDELPRLNPGLEIRPVTLEDAEKLALMYQKVFSSYSTPIFDGEYLANEMKEGMVYKAVWDGDTPVSAAAADLDNVNRAAELTDCGTIPEYRGKGLITLLIKELENELWHRKFRVFYGMARARSYGMNLVFRRLGYVYRGRLVNHSYICERFEDLNVWVKKLV